jgi:hypothetical protein
MKIDRRKFLLSSGLMASSAAAFTGIGLSGYASQTASASPGGADRAAAFDVAALKAEAASAIKIHGWEEVAVGDQPVDGFAWIGVNQQWRVAWR